jgi:hypothetical protein
MSRDVHGRTSVAEDMDVRERPDISVTITCLIVFAFERSAAELRVF